MAIEDSLLEDVTARLLSHLHHIAGKVILGPILRNDQIQDEKLQKPR